MVRMNRLQAPKPGTTPSRVMQLTKGLNVKALPQRCAGSHGAGRRHAVATAVLLSVTSLVLSACGGSDASSGGATAAGLSADQLAAVQKIADEHVGEPTAITQTTALPGAVPAGKKIVFANSGIPATQLIMDGVKEATEKIGWTFDQVNYESANPSTIQSALRTALTKGADAVIISGTPPTTYGKAVLEEYKKAGVPIIVGSTCPLEVTDPVVAGAAGCDSEKKAGTALGDWFVADSKGAGKVLFENVKAIPVLTTFVDAFKAEVAAKCPKCVVDVQEATLEQVAQNQIVPSLVNKLRSDPSYTYLFFDNAQWAKGIHPALKAAGLNDVKIGGRSADQIALGELANNTEVAWTATAYNVNGYANVDAAIRAVMGTTEGADGDVILPFQLLTPKNVAAVKAPYRYPTSALDSYLKLWNAS